MQPTSSPNWQSKLSAALRQDPKKTGILTVLAVILLVMGGRLLTQGGGRPALAVASTPQASTVLTSAFLPTLPAKQYGTNVPLHDWLTTPIPPVSRNIFLVKPEYFPMDVSKVMQDTPDGGFWADLGKSLSLQADQRDKRQNLIENYRVQAVAIRPQSIVMGPSPRAMINGTLVAEGDVVASFRVLRIQQRGIIVERDGIRFQIPMK